MYSPAIRRVSRLVARTEAAGHRRTTASARLAAASMTCSQLSRTRRSFLSPMARAAASEEISPLASFRPMALATVEGTRSGSDSEASSTSQTSPLNAGNIRRAASSANVVFPIPPGPVSVTARRSVRSSCTCCTAASRPTSSDIGAGRLVRGNLSGRRANKAALTLEGASSGAAGDPG